MSRIIKPQGRVILKIAIEVDDKGQAQCNVENVLMPSLPPDPLSVAHILSSVENTFLQQAIQMRMRSNQGVIGGNEQEKKNEPPVS